MQIVVDSELAAMLALCEQLDTPRSLTVYILLSTGNSADMESYLGLQVKPSEYISADSFSKDYLVTKYLSKWTGFTCYDNTYRKEEALRVLSDSEKLCLDTNARLSRPQREFSDVNGVLYLAKRKIADILGIAPSYKTWFGKCSWSNGSTFDLRSGTDFARKMTSRMTTTRECFPYVSHLVGHDIHWCRALGLDTDGPCCLLSSNFSFVRGNRLSVVPKTAKIDRTICIEPTANMFLQKGLGTIIREKLRRVGVELDDQRINQTYASLAHELGLCTVDLSSASDTVAVELVKTLLPFDWYGLLDAVRCHETLDRDEWIPFAKFSSMGNGFTFELESLIFYALTWATNQYFGSVTHCVNVYGDDIISPRDTFAQLVAVFKHCGFVINTEKSYSSGYFYESCGAHYFDGQLVTPVYQKAKVSRSPEEIIRAHNRLYRWQARAFGTHKAQRVFLRFFKQTFKELRNVPRVPEWADDRGFLSPANHLSRLCVNRGYYCFCYTPVSRFKVTDESAFLAYKLMHPGTSSSDPKGHARTSRADGYRYKYMWIPFGSSQ